MTEIDQSKAPPADCFRVGDWWQSPQGTRYLIVDRNLGPGRRVVWMRAGGRGWARLKYRNWDSIATKAGAWVRESWGGEVWPGEEVCEPRACRICKPRRV